MSSKTRCHACITVYATHVVLLPSVYYFTCVSLLTPCVYQALHAWMLLFSHVGQHQEQLESRDRYRPLDYASKTFSIEHLKICPTRICPICPGSSVLCPFKIQRFNRRVHLVHPKRAGSTSQCCYEHRGWRFLRVL